jgi:hypothetical protein
MGKSGLLEEGLILWTPPRADTLMVLGVAPLLFSWSI